MKNKTSLFKTAIIALAVCSLAFNASAQFLRTSFLMDDSHYRMKLNPALVPSHGYVDLPVIGNFNVTASSNTLGSQDIIDVFDTDNNNGNSLTSNSLYDRLEESNRMNLALNSEFLSFGWWKGKNFWSVNAGLRLDIGAQVPKSMFSLFRDFQDLADIDWGNYNMGIKDEGLYLNAYTELGVGYAREITESLTVGGKLKLLLGMGNLNMQINNISVETRNLNGDILDQATWNNGGYGRVKVNAIFESSFAGIKLLDRDGEINGYEFETFGIAGYGSAVDLGVAYKLTESLTLSAAVNDLGFINWSQNSTNSISVDTDREYNKDNYSDFLDIVNNPDLINYDLFGFKYEGNTESRTTALYSTIVAGGEYALLDDKISLGVLSSTHCLKPKTQSELTFGAAYRPFRMLNLAISYSVIQSAGKSLGLALKLGPLFIGTDYFYLGENTNIVNAFMGITVPLSGKKKNI
ncbi:MAG: DUF5723 family protein [Dysgonamonadaceae bacterium]|jgi:hypothetical protein|nr:DUF5723 family protein [Dysgonamonadaceae bacterium]